MLTLICGIPNAGKTTYSKGYRNVLHLDRMSPHRFVDKYTECARQASLYDGDVTVEGIYSTREFRKALLEACEEQERKVCIWLDTPLDKCVEREEGYRKRPNLMVMMHHHNFEPPSYDEGWDEIVRITE